MKKQRGFTLLELIVFIVIVGIVLTGVAVPLVTLLQKLPTNNHQTVALALARERMDLILGQRWSSGFSSFSDPCGGGSPPTICTPPTGYTVTSTIAAVTISGDSNYKTITVTVSGTGSATLVTLVGSY
jgi:prepilin-type N-terminal cleavage/methylation domain-containing protein